MRFGAGPPKLPEVWENALVDLIDGLFRRIWGAPDGSRRAQAAGAADDRDFWIAFADEFGMQADLDSRGRVLLSWGRQGVRFSGGADTRRGRDTGPMRFAAAGRSVEFNVIAADGAPKGRRRTGDPAFDGLCACYGDPNVITSSLTAPARARIADLIARGGEFKRGVASLTLPVPIATPGDAADALQCVVDAATLTDHAPTDRLERLLAVVDADTAPGVRARALSVAARTWPHAERVLAGLAAARQDHEPLRRMVGLLHSEAPEAAVALVRACDVPALVELVVDTASDEQLLPILLEASKRTDLRLLEAVAVGARRLPVAARLQVLANLGTHTRDATAEDGVTKATGDLLASTFPGSDAEPLEDAAFDLAMLAFVAHPDDVLARSAAQMLGEHGSWRSLAPLRAAVPKVSRRVRGRLEAAANAIQARTGDDRSGHVSIAEPDAHGRVSLHPDRPDPDA